MKNKVLPTFLMILVSSSLRAETCMEVKADPIFFKDSSTLLKEMKTDKVNIYKATVQLEYDDGKTTKTIETSVAPHTGSSKVCASKTKDVVSNIRAELRIVRSNGKEDGIQCQSTKARIVDRDYDLGKYNNPQIEVTLGKVRGDGTLNSYRKDYKVEECTYKITEAPQKKDSVGKKIIKKFSGSKGNN